MPDTVRGFNLGTEFRAQVLRTFVDQQAKNRPWILIGWPRDMWHGLQSRNTSLSNLRFDKGTRSRQ